ncbi:hypothetical protein MPH_06788 [Macrophomina phaseolina MS6]|uniref:Uncharacterized protein n=1 Tax=Macrophomina phaseolina (strain MS6) TaxID=1126212 RepID=K2RTE1_MACPH|nr:hypothetical protein MPH_06788 [Macrophomina phaseolina MS6]
MILRFHLLFLSETSLPSMQCRSIRGFSKRANDWSSVASFNGSGDEPASTDFFRNRYDGVDSVDSISLSDVEGNVLEFTCYFRMELTSENCLMA